MAQRNPQTIVSQGSDGATDHLRNILTGACDIAVFLDPAGRITQVVRGEDSQTERLADAEGRAFLDTLTPEGRGKFTSAMTALESGKAPARALELSHAGPRENPTPVRYKLRALAPGDGVVLLGRDMSDVAEMQSQLVQAQIQLEEGYETQREYDARYRLLLRSVSDRVLLLSAGDGKIRDANEPAAALFSTTREALIGRVSADLFQGRGRDEFTEALSTAATGETGSGLDAEMAAGSGPVTLVPTAFRAAGERLILVRIEPGDVSDAERDPLDLELSMLFDKSPDAIVFCSLSGTITACNESFLDMIGADSAADARMSQMSDFLGRGQVDFNVLTENARRAGKIRLYASKLVNEFGSEIPVEVSATYLNDRATPELGLILRSTHRSESGRAAQFQTSEQSSQNVMELVGSATLKEIVAETTDVVEKMCIETAINLTRNNRVAAAEMLGLSRQSLYVKLRKYDLLTRETAPEQ